MLKSFKQQNSGFSLVELMVTIALLGIMATVAAPNLADLIRRNQVQAQSDELFSLIQYARGQAVTRRTSYEIFPNADGSQWTAQRLNTNNDPSQRFFDINPNVAINTTNLAGGSLIFRPNGSASQAATFINCRSDKFEDAVVIQVRNSGVAQQFPRGKLSLDQNLASCTPP